MSKCLNVISDKMVSLYGLMLYASFYVTSIENIMGQTHLKSPILIQMELATPYMLWMVRTQRYLAPQNNLNLDQSGR